MLWSDENSAQNEKKNVNLGWLNQSHVGKYVNLGWLNQRHVGKNGFWAEFLSLRNITLSVILILIIFKTMTIYVS